MRHPRTIRLAVLGACAVVVAVSVTACTSAAESTTVVANASSGSGAGSALTIDSGNSASSTVSAGPTGSDAAVSPSTSADLEAWIPTEANPDPSVAMDGIFVGDPVDYAQRYHFATPIRVAYDRYPPIGGPHDPIWAACDGVAYSSSVRNENMVHALEHGAVWIAYNPDLLTGDPLAGLIALVTSTPYLVMTPYPGLATALSLQSWGHQLALDDADDPRLPQFVVALLRNPYLTPEVSATCSRPDFDTANPPPLDPTPPGADAIPMDYQPPAAATS